MKIEYNKKLFRRIWRFCEILPTNDSWKTTNDVMRFDAEHNALATVVVCLRKLGFFIRFETGRFVYES